MRGFESPEDVFGCLQAFSASAALGAALELGLPWMLDAEPLDDAGVAAALGIPLGRCRWWLRVLEHLGLLESSAGRYSPTPGARRAILESYRRESWAFLAREERERLPTVLDLASRLRLPPAAVPTPEGLDDYVAAMAADPERARVFTRMLSDLHRALAEALADVLDLAGCRRLLDLGGGSGVMSLALARRHPGLSAAVVDIENVCAEGRRMVAEAGLSERITFAAGDLAAGQIPRGFDVALECDVGVYGEALFRAVAAALDEGGRFVIADLMGETAEDLPERVLHWGFTAAVAGTGEPSMSWQRLRGLLAESGFRVVRETPLPEGFRLLEAAPTPRPTP